MVPIRDLPKAFVAVVLGVELFIHVLPNIRKGAPDWLFGCWFLLSFGVAWLITAGAFKAVGRVIKRKG